MKKLFFYFISFVVLLPCYGMAQNTPSHLSSMLVYPVEIDGKPYNFLLDASFSHSRIDQAVINKDKTIINNATNNNDEPSVIVPELKIADTVFQNTVMYNADLSSLAYQFYGMHIDGMLGMDIYTQFIWDVDNKNGKKTIYSLKDEQPENNYAQCIYYQKNIKEIPAETILINNITKEGKVIPFILVTDIPASAIASSQQKNIKLSTVGIDNVSNTANINEKKDNIGIDREQITYYLMQDFAFENFPIKASTFHSSDNPHHLNYLGMDFLSRFDQYRLNPLNGSLCFNHFDNSSKIIVRHLAIRAFDGHIELYSNSNNYLRQSGLQNGDIIVSVNGVSYPTAQIVGLREILNYTQKLDLQINRNGEIRHVIIDSAQ